MKFNYQVRTKEGELKAGQVEASSKDAAMTLLQRYGFYVTFLEEDVAPIYARKLRIFEKITGKEVVMFSRQLSIMFKAKVPLTESLKVLASQIKNDDFKEKVIGIADDVEAGTPFSKALAKYPKIFSAFYIAVVRAGEASGSLSHSLNYLADHLEREYHLTAKIRGAMIYPAMILLVVVMVILLMFFYVIPRFAQTFAESQVALPLTTRLVIDFAAFLKDWLWLGVVLIAASLIFLIRYFKTNSGKIIIDNFLLRMPIFGNLLRMIYLSRMAENLSTLFAGGLPIAQSLDIVADIIGNSGYRRVIALTRDGVRRGETVSSVLVAHPNLFPPVFVQMIMVGERTGTLDKTLADVVEFYQREIDRSIDNMLSLIEPVLIVLLGFVVVGIMLSVFAPLYQMISL